MATTTERDSATDRRRRSLLFVGVATILAGIARISNLLVGQSHDITLAEATTPLSLALLTAGFSLLLLGVAVGRR